jgi:hypothetical protein
MLKQSELPVFIKIALVLILLPLIISGYDKGYNESPVFASKQMSSATDEANFSHEYIASNRSTWTCTQSVEKNLLSLKFNHYKNDLLFKFNNKQLYFSYDGFSGINYRYHPQLQTVVLLI